MEKTLTDLAKTLHDASQEVIKLTGVALNAQRGLTAAQDRLAVSIEWKTLGTNADQRRAALVKLSTDNPGNSVGDAARDVLKAMDHQAQADGAVTLATHVLDDARAQLRVVETLLKVRNLADVRKAGK